MIRAIVFAVCLAFLVGCTKPAPISGTVIAKKYIPAYVDVIYNYDPLTGGTTPMFIQVPEEYRLTIRQDSGAEARRSVTKEQYDALKEGDRYDEKP